MRLRGSAATSRSVTRWVGSACRGSCPNRPMWTVSSYRTTISNLSDRHDQNTKPMAHDGPHRTPTNPRRAWPCPGSFSLRARNLSRRIDVLFSSERRAIEGAPTAGCHSEITYHLASTRTSSPPVNSQTVCRPRRAAARLEEEQVSHLPRVFADRLGATRRARTQSAAEPP